jgi:hypothetical protein
MSDIDKPIDLVPTEKAIAAYNGASVAVKELETPPTDEQLWGITRVVIHVRGDGVLPPLPPIVEPIRARLFVEARSEAVRRLGGWVAPTDVEITRIR